MNKVLDNILSKIRKTINGVDLKPHAKNAAEQIRKRTRIESGLSETERGSKKKKLKKLSPKYKTARAKSDKLNKGLTKPNKSNLTFTGQLLDSLRGSAQRKSIVIDFKENRSDGKKNVDIMNYQKDQDRHFFELTDKEVKGLQRALKADLINNIKKKL